MKWFHKNIVTSFIKKNLLKFLSTSKDDMVVMTSRETQTKRKAGGINRERA